MWAGRAAATRASRPCGPRGSGREGHVDVQPRAGRAGGGAEGDGVPAGAAALGDLRVTPNASRTAGETERGAAPAVHRGAGEAAARRISTGSSPSSSAPIHWPSQRGSPPARARGRSRHRGSPARSSAARGPRRTRSRSAVRTSPPGRPRGAVCQRVGLRGSLTFLSSVPDHPHSKVVGEDQRTASRSIRSVGSARRPVSGSAGSSSTSSTSSTPGTRCSAAKSSPAASGRPKGQPLPSAPPVSGSRWW